jgi:uroporphyrinogen decarboxylase
LVPSLLILSYSFLPYDSGTEATLLGFIGTPWTLAAYAMEGKADKDCKQTKVRSGGDSSDAW